MSRATLLRPVSSRPLVGDVPTHTLTFLRAVWHEHFWHSELASYDRTAFFTSFEQYPSTCLLSMDDVKGVVKGELRVRVLVPNAYTEVRTLDAQSILKIRIIKADTASPCTRRERGYMRGSIGCFYEGPGGRAVSGAGADVWLKACPELAAFYHDRLRPLLPAAAPSEASLSLTDIPGRSAVLFQSKRRGLDRIARQHL